MSIPTDLQVALNGLNKPGNQEAVAQVANILAQEVDTLVQRLDALENKLASLGHE